MVGADTTLQIARHGVIYKFWIRQIEVCHGVAKLRQSALSTEPDVALFFLGDGGNTPAFVIVCWIHQRLIG